MACKLCRIIVYHKHPRYKFFSFLHPPWGLDGRRPGGPGHLDLHKLSKQAATGMPQSDDSGNKHSSSGSLSREVYLDNAHHFVAVFLRKTQGSSPPPALPFLTHAP